MINIFLLLLLLIQLTFRNIRNSSSFSSGDIIEIFLFDDYE